jgi:RNA polymerase subunit RPABC4/transcription elongation factor Spt4
MLDSWQSVLALVGAILIAYGLVLWLGTVVWVYRDIRERTHDTWSQKVSVALVVLFNIPGLILYLVLRPGETLLEAYERRLEKEALMAELPERRTCPSCARPVREDFLLCPNCGATLRESCSGCGRALELSWAVCPYCGAKGPQVAVAPPPMAAGTPFAPVASSTMSGQALPTAPPTRGQPPS